MYLCFPFHASATHLARNINTRYNYLVRFTNSDCKFVANIWHDVHERFVPSSALKLKLVESFEEKIPSFSDLDYGYLSNAKCWIEDNQDLEAMYKVFSHASEVVAKIWNGTERWRNIPFHLLKYGIIMISHLVPSCISAALCYL